MSGTSALRDEVAGRMPQLRAWLDELVVGTVVVAVSESVG